MIEMEIEIDIHTKSKKTWLCLCPPASQSGACAKVKFSRC